MVALAGEKSSGASLRQRPYNHETNNNNNAERSKLNQETRKWRDIDVIPPLYNITVSPKRHLKRI